MYNFIKPLIFLLLSAERAHNMGLKVVALIGSLYRLNFISRPDVATHPKLKVTTVFGEIPSLLGLAAGFDKNAIALWGWEALGFGFVEVGTVTPFAQPGNPKPRMFRYVNKKAVVNRLGFNNQGMHQVVKNIQKARKQGLRIKIGGNVGKNLSTPLEHAASDYRKAALALAPHVDYIAVNVSSPNTPGLRSMQAESFLEEILKNVKEVSLNKPIFVKVAPDHFEDFQTGIIHLVHKYAIAGVICGNTLANHASCAELNDLEIAKLPQGGLSGSPVFKNNLQLAQSYKQQLPDKTVIGVGGITTAERACEYLHSKCDLIQVYSGFVFEGPAFISDILEKVLQLNILSKNI